jgi:DNA-binding XRE family transcriptional regulator
MPFVETDMEQESRELQSMIDSDPLLQESAKQFEKEYQFRKKLIMARKEAGLTQKEIEKISGIPYRAISRLETNSEISPNLRTLFKYLNAIGYDLDIVKL